MYQLKEGQIAYILHRVSGVGIILFLFAHIVENFMLLMGPDAYNVTIGNFHTWYFRLGEFALIMGVVYHGLNGIRIIIVDFWQRSTDYHKHLWYAVMIISVLIAIWIGKIMLWDFQGWPWQEAVHDHGAHEGGSH